MKKGIIIINIMIIFSLFLHTVENEDSKKINFKNNTILILPFFNESNEKDYDYLSNTLTINIRSELMEKNITRFPDINDINKRMEIANFSNKDLNNKDNAILLAKRLNSDIVIYGSFMIDNDKIIIKINGIYVKTGTILFQEKYQDRLREDMSDFYSNISKNFVDNLLEKELIYVDKIKKDTKDDKYKLKIVKRKLFPVNIAGIALSSTGGTFLLTGVPILIYDLAGYSDVLREKMDGPKTEKGYSDYDTAYNTFIALFAVSTTLTSIGVVLVAIGIPLTFYRFRDTIITMNLKLTNNIKLYLSYKF